MKNIFFNNIVFKEVKEFNIIFLVLIGLFLIGISGFSSYAIFSDEIVSNNEIKGIIKEQIVTGAGAIIKKVGTDGIVAETHPATSQLKATTDYRYTGKNPNNYVKFNNEVWRIIGVFEVDDGTGKLEKRIKLIGNYIGEILWDSNSKNDWTQATGMQHLNSGDYYNRTGSYASNGLTSKSRRQIAPAKWYLGGTGDYQSASNGLTSHFYNYERSNTVYNKNQTSWTGNVGLMYPSDYGYATSGGSVNNRTACLAKELYSWNEVSDCFNNDWLYDATNYKWTITQHSTSQNGVFYLGTSGYVGEEFSNLTNSFYPCVYLRADIQIINGDGSSTNPYELMLPSKTTVDMIINKEGTDGIVAEEHPATSQLAANVDYRYTGANPNNYIKFNNETWRIIGVFDTDDGTGNLEKRIKIIGPSIENMVWDNNDVNDWTKADGMTLLNSGDYYNRTGSYTTNGLTADAKSMIADAKWYLGGTGEYNSISDGLATHIYNNERGAIVYTGRPTKWIGKVGLMYASDYGYATSGGTIKNRDACLAKELVGWNSSTFSDCKSNNWLFNSNTQWTISPDSESSDFMFLISGNGNAYKSFTSIDAVFRPSVFLSTNVKIVSGTGKQSDPYILEK